MWTSIPSVSVSTPIIESLFNFSKLSSIEITLYKSVLIFKLGFSVTK